MKSLSKYILLMLMVLSIAQLQAQDSTQVKIKKNEIGISMPLDDYYYTGFISLPVISYTRRINKKFDLSLTNFFYSNSQISSSVKIYKSNTTSLEFRKSIQLSDKLAYSNLFFGVVYLFDYSKIEQFFNNDITHFNYHRIGLTSGYTYGKKTFFIQPRFIIAYGPAIEKDYYSGQLIKREVVSWLESYSRIDISVGIRF